MEKKIYGNSQEESDILERSKSRDIVKVILDYGVSQNQILHIIKLLALELECNSKLKAITSIIDNNTQSSKTSILTGE